MLKMNIIIMWVLLLFLFPFTEKGIAQTTLIGKERARLSSIKDCIELINSMSHVGMLYQAKNIDSCFYYGLKAKSLAIKLHYAKGEIDADNVIGTALSLRGLSKESLATYGSVLTRYQKQHDTANVVQVLMNIALVYGELADDIKSKRYFHQALNIGRSLRQDSILSML